MLVAISFSIQYYHNRGEKEKKKKKKKKKRRKKEKKVAKAVIEPTAAAPSYRQPSRLDVVGCSDH